MKRWHASYLVLVFALAMFDVLSGASTRQVEEWDLIENFRERLESLSPHQPLAYFELGEDILDILPAGGTAADRQLARELFSRAAVLDPERLGRSAALALAELAEDEAENRRMLAFATLLGDGIMRSPHESKGSEPSIAALRAFGDAMSFHRRQWGTRAVAALREPGAMQLLERYGHPLGGSQRVLSELNSLRGGARPALVRPQDLTMMRIELGLWEGQSRSWGADLVISRNRSLIEIDLAHLEAELDVAENSFLYRHGRWVPPATDE